MSFKKSNDHMMELHRSLAAKHEHSAQVLQRILDEMKPLQTLELTQEEKYVFLTTLITVRHHEHVKLHSSFYNQAISLEEKVSTSG